jgi:serine/threonine protein kinase
LKDEPRQSDDAEKAHGELGDETQAWESPASPDLIPTTKDAWEGKVVGRYRSLSLLGRGAFGAVYRAYAPELSRSMAVKIPRADSEPGSEKLRRFLREARSAARLHHPHIVTIHDIGSHDDTSFVVSEYGSCLGRPFPANQT